MTKLTEQDIISTYVGKAVDPESFERLATKNPNEYVIYNSRYMDNPEFQELLQITDRLHEIWSYGGISLDLHLKVDEGIVIAGHIDKCREGCGGHGRPTVHVLTPTQQELRIARRILQYITTS